MSRIGKRAVPIPSGVTATVEGQTVKVKGPKGAMQVVLPDDVTAKMDKGSVKVDPRAETDRARAMWGTSRTLVANLMTGVTKGFESKLENSGSRSPASAIGRRCRARTCRSRSATATM
jgi:large subunit ribosomal protein L6